MIVLEPGLVIHRIYNGYWFFGRPTIEDLRQDLRAVLRKCQPDWDITKSELKAIWQQGKKELFSISRNVRTYSQPTGLERTIAEAAARRCTSRVPTYAFVSAT